jgi:N-methylhydantoinase A
VARLVDMRFRFQIHELTMELPSGAIDGPVLDDLVRRFIESYEARFGEGSAFSAAGVELVNWRVIATGAIDRADISSAAGVSSNGSSTLTPVRVDEVYDDGWVEFSIYGESQMAPGVRFDGPAVVELSDTNIVVGREQSASVDAHGNVVIAL